MDTFQDHSIRRKLMAMSLLASAGALLLAATAFITYDFLTFRRSLVTVTSTLAEIVSVNAASAVVFNDSLSAVKTLAALKARHSIVSAGIYTPQGILLAHWEKIPGDPPTSPPDRMDSHEVHHFASGTLTLFHPILLDNSRIGTVAIKTDLRDLWARLRRYMVIAGSVLIISLIVAGSISLQVGRIISAPILHLVDVAQAISEKKDYAVRAQGAGPDEMGLLVRTFNGMLNKIQEDALEIRRLNEDLEKKVQDRTVQLTTANQELEAFSYSVSHDLRAPLRHIGGFTDLLLKNAALQDNPSAKRYLTMVVDSVRQMGVLIDDLLSFSRMGRSDMLKSKLDLNEIVQSVIAELKPQAEGRAVDWKIGMLPEVHGDPAMIRIVFMNLLSNALKYSRMRKPAAIEIGSEKSPEGQTVIFVRDNGAGFDMKYADKLFGVFQRLHSSDEFEGTGIGLATVRRVIQRHDGRIWAQAAVDQGATFYVAFS